MIIGILKEPEGENRVSLLPESVSTLVKLKNTVQIEKKAGSSAYTLDEEYVHAGATIASREEILKGSEVIIGIHPLDKKDLEQLNENQVLVNILNPLENKELVRDLKQRGITSFSMDVVPRTTRAQAMDILSSMATAAGYKAVLDAAMHLPTFFPMFMTAAGTITPAKVLILGAGVAGLQAIATSRKLGARVEAFDVRSAVKEEVQSLGAKFVEVEGASEDKAAGGYAVEQSEDYKRRQQEAINDHAAKANVVISTAQIPGRKAPLLISKETVERMQPGSVIVDLAASTGGNCELTKNNETIVHKRVIIIGQSNYPSSIPKDASKMFGKNVVNFLKLLMDDEGKLILNFDDDIVKGTCVTHNKEIINERVKQLYESK